MGHADNLSVCLNPQEAELQQQTLQLLPFRLCLSCHRHWTKETHRLQHVILRCHLRRLQYVILRCHLRWLQYVILRCHLRWLQYVILRCHLPLAPTYDPSVPSPPAPTRDPSVPLLPYSIVCDLSPGSAASHGSHVATCSAFTNADLRIVISNHSMSSFASTVTMCASLTSCDHGVILSSLPTAVQLVRGELWLPLLRKLVCDPVVGFCVPRSFLARQSVVTTRATHQAARTDPPFVNSRLLTATLHSSSSIPSASDASVNTDAKLLCFVTVSKCYARMRPARLLHIFVHVSVHQIIIDLLGRCPQRSAVSLPLASPLSCQSPAPWQSTLTSPSREPPAFLINLHVL